MDQANNRGAGATPTTTNTAGAVPSIDTAEFRELLAKAMDAAELATRTGEPHRDYKPARDELIAHINAHVQAVLRSNQEKGGAQ